MKKILFIFALFYSNASFAACFAVTGATTDCAQATEYQVSVSKVELCADAACTSAVTVADTTASFDIATAAVGAQVGAYANLNTEHPDFVTELAKHHNRIKIMQATVGFSKHPQT